MIYLVTNNQELFDSDLYKIISVEESLEIMKDWPCVQFDTETSGLDPHINQLICIQFGSKNVQIVVDCSCIRPTKYKTLLESKLLLAHNAKFDLQFLYNYAIIPMRVYDTMIAEQTMYMGFPYQKLTLEEYQADHYDFPIVFNAKENLWSTSYSLKALCFKYLHLEMDKSIREEIPDRGLCSEVIKYAANDVVHLQEIAAKQIQAAKQKTMLEAIKLECKFIPVLAYMEWCGVKLDEVKWKAKMEKDQQNLTEAVQALNDFVIRTPSLAQFTYVNMQGDLFLGWDLTPKCTINWSSSKQVIPVCKILGFNTTTIDKKTGVEKDTVLEKELTTQKGVNDEFLNLYFTYQGYSKVVSSFGQTWLDSINPITGRIHTKFSQLGASSGRLSCGGGENKDLTQYKHLPSGSCKLLNFQQLPHDEETRACFVAEPGNLWCSCDFSAN